MQMTSRLLAALTMTVSLCASAWAQPSAPMTNADVLKLLKAGIGDAVVVSAIQQAPSTAFETNVDAVIRLKASGASDAVLTAIMTRRAPTAPTAAAPAARPGSVTATPAADKPVARRDPGIYVDTGASPDPLVPLEPTVFSQGKTGGMLSSVLTYGIKKVKLRAIVRSPSANIRTRNQRPTFYFYFADKSSGPGGFGGWLSAATSPNEFVLVQMTEKRDSRELVVGEVGSFGANAGTCSEDSVPVKVERLEPGVYRVTPTEDLGPGEFCFFYAAAQTAPGGTAGKLFDFGVDETAEVTR